MTRWDKRGAVRYVKPGRGDVFARFRRDEAAIEQVRIATAAGGKHEPTFGVCVADRCGETIVVVDKTLHFRRLAGGTRRAAA